VKTIETGIYGDPVPAWDLFSHNTSFPDYAWTKPAHEFYEARRIAQERDEEMTQILRDRPNPAAHERLQQLRSDWLNSDGDPIIYEKFIQACEVRMEELHEIPNYDN
jgi:hypothetical protein